MSGTGSLAAAAAPMVASAHRISDEGEVLKGPTFADSSYQSQTLPPRAVHRCRDRYTRTLGRWVVGVEGSGQKGASVGRRTSFSPSLSRYLSNPDLRGTLRLRPSFWRRVNRPRVRPNLACESGARGSRNAESAAAATGRRRGGVSSFNAFTAGAQRSFVKKTKAGRVMVVRERTLRDDYLRRVQAATRGYRARPGTWRLLPGGEQVHHQWLCTSSIY